MKVFFCTRTTRILSLAKVCICLHMCVCVCAVGGQIEHEWEWKVAVGSWEEKGENVKRC